MVDRAGGGGGYGAIGGTNAGGGGGYGPGGKGGNGWIPSGNSITLTHVGGGGAYGQGASSWDKTAAQMGGGGAGCYVQYGGANTYTVGAPGICIIQYYKKSV